MLRATLETIHVSFRTYISSPFFWLPFLGVIFGEFFFRFLKRDSLKKQNGSHPKMRLRKRFLRVSKRDSFTIPPVPPVPDFSKIYQTYQNDLDNYFKDVERFIREAR